VVLIQEVLAEKLLLKRLLPDLVNSSLHRRMGFGAEAAEDSKPKATPWVTKSAEIYQRALKGWRGPSALPERTIGLVRDQYPPRQRGVCKPRGSPSGPKTRATTIALPTGIRWLNKKTGALS
jgi:hypothetical protein